MIPVYTWNNKPIYLVTKKQIRKLSASLEVDNLSLNEYQMVKGKIKLSIRKYSKTKQKSIKAEVLEDLYDIRECKNFDWRATIVFANKIRRIARFKGDYTL